MGIARVNRTRDEARAAYDRMAPSYDRFAGRFERRFTEQGLALLAVQPGERVLELGYGTGTNLVELGRAVGTGGSVVGVDLSEGMARVASERIRAAGLDDRVDVHVGDAASLDAADGTFDAAFASFTLELFDTPELPGVLAEWRRVLRPGGRLGLVAMALSETPGVLGHLYVWSHRRFPDWVDCRPIPAPELVRDAGFDLARVEQRSMWGLPVWLVMGRLRT